VIASRLMALTVGGISIAVGLVAAARLTLAPVDGWFEGRDILVSGAVLTAVLAAFTVGMLAARRRAPVRAAANSLPSLLAPETPQRT
jgi:hypothetical protein